MDKVKILVCCHKQDIMATQEPFMPIQVGKALSDVDLGIQGDDTGDNISEKNRSYCELTGLYWAWKNLKDVDVIGMCHYRRYFDFHGQVHPVRYNEVIPTDKFNTLDLSIPENIIEKVKGGGKVIIGKPRYYGYSVCLDYCRCHYSEDFRTLQAYMKETQPEHIRRAFRHVMHRTNGLPPANMFIMPFEMFDRYCQWIFSVLGGMEERIDISHYTPSQARIWGYMAERLFNVWLRAERADIIHRPILVISDWRGDRVPTLSLWERNLRYKIGFEFTREHQSLDL